MKSNQTFTILFWLNKSKGSNGFAPIWVRVTVNGKRSEFSTGKKININSWDHSKGRIKAKDKLSGSINEYLDILKGDLIKTYNILLSNGQLITANAIKVNYLGKTVSKKTLLDFFSLFLEKRKLEVENDELAEGTYKRFQVTKGKCEAYLRDYLKCRDIALDEITMKFIVEFEYYLKMIDKISHNTANKYCKNLKQVLKAAVVLDFIIKNPLENFKCSFKKTHRDTLDENELSIITNKEISIQRLDEVRDVYLFACYTGYSFEELESLSKSNICTRIDGEQWIMLNREKTDEKENVPLLPIPLLIIQKYSNHPYCVANDRLLPVKSNQKYNAYLKELATICGIKKNLTSHTARHTFATTVTLANDVPIETVSEMLGHQDIRTTKIYAKMVQKKISNDMKKLKNKLINSLPTSIKNIG